MKFLKNQMLGNLCKRNHNYKETGKSLRRTSNKDCIECSREYNLEYEKTHLERKEGYKHRYYIYRNSENGKEVRIKYSKRRSNELTDSYIKDKLVKESIALTSEDISGDIIELKRLNLKIFRFIREKCNGKRLKRFRYGY